MMGMFGALKRKPMFGEIPGMGQMQGNGGIVDVGGSLPYETMGRAGAMDPNTQAMTKKPGFFAPGQAGRHIVGFIGDALQRLGGGEGTYMPHMMQMQQQDAEIRARLQEAIAKKKADRENFIFEQDYKRQNPMPINNDTVNDLNWYKGLSDEDRKLYHQMKPVTGLRADGTPYAYNPYELNQRSGPKPGTIEDGHEFIGGDPSDPKSWRPVAGGGGSNVTEGFQPRL